MLLGPTSPPRPLHRDIHPPANGGGGCPQPVWCGEGRVWLPVSSEHGRAPAVLLLLLQAELTAQVREREDVIVLGACIQLFVPRGKHGVCV